MNVWWECLHCSFETASESAAEEHQQEKEHELTELVSSD